MQVSPNLKKAIIITTITISGLFVLAFSLIYFFQDKIINATINELNKYIVTKVEVREKIELSLFSKFPEISVKFQNVDVYENAAENPQKLAHAGKLYLSFNFWNFLHSSYTINHLYFEDGFIKIKIDKKGSKNYEIIKSDTTSIKQEVGFELEKIILKNVNITYENIPGHQYHDILLKEAEAQLKLHQEQYKINLESAILVNAISIAGDQYFKSKDILVKSFLEYDANKETFKILPTNVQVENADFKVQGMFEFKKRKKMDITIKEENASIQTILSLMPKKFYKEFRSYQSTGEIYCSSIIKGNISNHEFPHVEVDFGFKNASIFHPGLDKKIDKASFHGYYTNGTHHNATTSVLKISNIHCSMDQKTFTGDFSLTNFKDPILECQAKGKIDAEVLSGFYKHNTIKSVSGIVDFNISILGRINDLQKKQTAQNVKASGEISLINMSLATTYSPLVGTGINGDFIFSNNDISISNFIAKIGKSDIHVDGYLKNFVNKVFFNTQSLYLEADLKSSYLDVDEMLSSNTSKESNQTIAGDSSVNAQVANSFSGYDFQINCNVRRLKYQLMNIQNLKGIVNFNEPHIGFKDVSCDVIGGSISGNAYVNKGRGVYYTNLQADVKDIYIDSVFYIFKNFDQKFIVQKNIKGEITGAIHANMNLSKSYDIDPATLSVSIDAVVNHGELVDFEPMRRLSKFIDEKKLERIQFSEIKNKILIENQKIFIPEMEIKSNASDLSISGTHTFDHEMDYRITVPLKNFKKKKEDKDAVYGAIEEDGKGNANIFLTIKGNTDNYKIAYDTEKTGKKIKADLKKEKMELQGLFKRKKIKEEQIQEKQQEEFFDFDK